MIFAREKIGMIFAREKIGMIFAREKIGMIFAREKIGTAHICKNRANPTKEPSPSITGEILGVNNSPKYLIRLRIPDNIRLYCPL